MGEVYLAEDIRLGRPVALKFLPAALKADPDSRARLLNEARAASLLRSPNIAVTYDIGEHAGTDFIVMEFVEGELLSQRVALGPLPVREAVDVGLQVADALDEAHSRGIIHRDIKSANLIRTGRGLVKVLDFGLAKFLATKPRSELVTQQQMTVAGMVVGTIWYMSPEQALGRSVDHRADLFSLGVVLYELATGRIPFAGTSPTEIVEQDPARGAAAAVCAQCRGAEGARRDRDACDGEVADLPLPDGARHAPGPARAGRGARGVVPRQQQPCRGRHRQPAGLGDRTLGGGDDLRQYHPRAGRRLDRHRHRGNGQLGSQEHPRPDRDRPGARLRRAAQPRLERQPRRVARHRHRPPPRGDVGGGGRLPEDERARAHHRELRRRRHRRRASDGQGRRPRRRHLRAPGQDRLRAQSGAEPGAARHRGRRDRAARNQICRGLRKLRARHDEPAPGQPGFHRARHRRLRARDAQGPGVRARVGRPRRRLQPQGLVPECARSDRGRDRDRAAGAVDRPRARRRAHLAGRGPPQPRTHRRGDRRHSRGDPPGAGQRSGAPGPGARLLGRPRRFRVGDSRIREGHRIEPGGRLFISPARAAAGLGRAVRARRGSVAAGRRAAGSSTSRAMPGCRSSARTADSATSTTCRAATTTPSASTNGACRSSARATMP